MRPMNKSLGGNRLEEDITPLSPQPPPTPRPPADVDTVRTTGGWFSSVQFRTPTPATWLMGSRGGGGGRR